MSYKIALYFFIISVFISFTGKGQKYFNGEALITVTSKAVQKQNIIFEGPPEWEGLEVQYQIGDTYSGKGEIKKDGKISGIEFIIDATREEIDGKPFLFYVDDFPIVVVHSIYEYINTTNNIRNNATLDRFQIKLFGAEVGTEKDWVLDISVSQGPGMLPLLQELSESNLKNGTIFLMIASHQDTGWEDTPAHCATDRDLKIITPALKLLKENPEYKFNVENMLSLMEFLERNPRKKEEIYQLTKEGRLTWGGMFNQPYEEIYPGESLARQFYFGRKWFKENFKGLDTHTVWNVDVPGRTLQSPQLMAKAGIKYLLVSRQQQGVFEWQSPDGSKIKVFSPGDYGETWRQLQKSDFRSFRHFAGNALQYEDLNDKRGKNAIIPFMANKDMSPPYTYKTFIEKWNNTNFREISKQEKIKLNLPKITYATPHDFFSELEKNGTRLPVIQGERPNIWLYIHGPGHHKILSAIREGNVLLTAAEKFATFNALLEKNWNNYPQSEFNRIWKEHIYPDHGFGGKNGHITDQIFLNKTLDAKNSADSVLRESLNSIASRIDFGKNKGIPMVVFNSMSKQRTNPLHVKLNLKEHTIKNFYLTDSSGKEITYQVTELNRTRKGNISQIEFIFLAERVPSLGYKTYFLVPSGNAGNRANQNFDLISRLENNYYRIDLGHGGIVQIRDKELNKDLFTTDKFLGGELFSMQSVGTGAGEFDQVQQPTMEGFEKISDYQPVWQNYKSGPLFQSIEYVQKIKHAVVKQKIILYNQVKKIDFQLSLLNWEGIQYREFRLAFPININRADITYEVPFGKVEIGKDEIPGAPGERYQVEASEIRPRSVLNWIDVSSDNDVGITFSSSVAVWDYKDPTNAPVDYPLLQPVLLASRRSCHGMGNWYLQEGDHQFEFSLTSHPPGWENGFHSALEHNEPLLTVFNPGRMRPKLPPELSFFNVDKPNVIISAIKKNDTRDNTIIRFYETEGTSSVVKLDSYFPVDKLEKCNLIEEPKEEIFYNQEVRIGKYAVETFKLN
jgi:alpha-mannosidase